MSDYEITTEARELDGTDIGCVFEFTNEEGKVFKGRLTAVRHGYVDEDLKVEAQFSDDFSGFTEWFEFETDKVLTYVGW